MKARLVLLFFLFISIEVLPQSAEEYYESALEAFRGGNYTNAILNAEKAIAAFEEDEELETGYYNSVLIAAFSYNATSSPDKSIKLVTRVRGNYENGEDETYASLSNALGEAYQTLNNLQMAETLYREANAVYLDIYGFNSQQYGDGITKLAVVKFLKQDYKLTEKLLLDARDIFKEVFGENHIYYGYGLSNLATLYRDIGEYEKAEPLFQVVLEIYKREFGENNVNYAQQLNGAAILYRYTGNVTQAEKYFTKASHIWKEKYGENSDEYTVSIMNLGVLYNDLGNYPKAEELLLKAVKIREKLYGIAHPQYAQALNNLASVYYSTKDFVKVTPLLLEALDIYKKVYGEEHQLYNLTRQNLAQIYSTQGEYGKADSLFTATLKFYKQKVGDQHPDYLQVYSNLGVLYYLSGDYQKAETVFKEVMRSRVKVLGENNPDCINSLFILGSLYSVSGRIPEAIPLLDKSLTLANKYLRASFTGLSEAEKSRLVNKYGIFYDFTMNAISSGDAPGRKSIYEKLLFRKGLVLNSSVNTRTFINSAKDSILNSLYSQLLEIKKIISDLYSKSETERARSGYNLDSIEEVATQIEKTMADRSSTFKDFVMVNEVKWDDIKNRLKPDEAIIDIVKFPWFDKKWTETAVFDKNKYAVFITKKDTSGEPAYYEFKDGNYIDTVVIPALNLLNQEGGGAVSTDPDDDKVIDLSDGKDNSIDFHAMLFAPLVKNLNGVKRIYLSLDGEFYKVNFGTIKNPETGKYLIEEYEFVYLSSPTELARTGSGASLKKTAVMAGYPNYNLSLDSMVAEISPDKTPTVSREVWVNTGAIQNYQLQLLPGTKEEALTTSEQLRKSGWEVESLLYDDASESNIKNVKAPTILSISTHGFFASMPKADYKESFLMGADAKKASENPMLRSGLFLSGAESYLNSPEAIREKFPENGILTAFEAAQLDLIGTDIVILSACETGLGEVNNGEGVFGLQRGFLSAGARSVLMSLWKVDDNATRDLMIKFVTNYANGMGKSMALRQAQLQLMKQYPKPYYWGAFIMTGR